MNFWMLDVDQELVNNQATVRLWGITGEGHRAVLTDAFDPYFYLIVKGEPESVIRDIEALEITALCDLKAEARRFYGKDVAVVKVTCKDAAKTQGLASRLSRVEGVVDHVLDDLRPTSLYMIDRGITPCAWVSVDAERTAEGDVAAYRVVRWGKVDYETRPPALRKTSFRILCASERGSPNPETDPILIITAETDGDIVQFEVGKESERALIQNFVDHLQKTDPDVIAGFGSNTLDIPYLMERASKLGCKFAISRTGSPPHRSVYGHISVTGRANIDLLDVANDIADIELKDLDSTADFFGVKIKDREQLTDYEIGTLWKTRKELVKKHEDASARIIRALLDENMDFMISLSQLTGLPLDHVLAAAVGFRVDSFLVKEAFVRGELPPRRQEREYVTYAGGLVLNPTPGIHEHVAVIDFKSMYPSIMLAHNISPDTLVQEPGNKAEEIEGLSYGFKQKPPGLYASTILRLLGMREALKEKLRGVKDEAELRILRERERAIKILTNAIYGYAGWSGARWYSREVAEATAHLGRQAITSVIGRCGKLGLKVVYGDTDSVFVRREPEKVTALIEWAKTTLGLEVKIDKVYRRLIFTESKKKYAGLTESGKVDIVGMESVRSDWPQAARNAQREILTLTLEGAPSHTVLKKAKEIISTFKKKPQERKDLVVWKAITRPLSQYAVKAPHVEVAKRLAAKGWKIKPGDKLGYIVKKGKGRLHERAEYYLDVDLQEVDYDYYLLNQVVPAMLRPLNVLGFTEKDLLGAGPEQRLTDFS